MTRTRPCINPNSGTTLDPTIRLRLATRIHFALRRMYGEDVEVSTLLRGTPEAREALWACEASGDAELVALAKQFAEANAAMAAEAAKPAPQDTVWSQDTSGFGLTRPPALAEAPLGNNAPSASWLRPASWLRRGNTAR